MFPPPPEALATAFGAGSEGAHAAASTALFLGQIAIMLGVGRLAGELLQRVGSSAVMGQVLAGILIGPSVFGVLAPGAFRCVFPESGEQRVMIDAIAHIGVLMLLLLTGMETDLGLVQRVKRAAVSVSICGIAVPFSCGLLLGELMPAWLLPDPRQRLTTSLFLGTALSISSVKVVAVVLKEMGFIRRNVGQVILATAVIDDTIGWIVIAIISSIAMQGGVSLGTALWPLAGTAVFLAFCFSYGRRIVGLLIRLANDHLKIDFAVITTILVVMSVFALVTDLMGVHSVLGAFVAGILIGQSPLLTRHIEEQLRGLIVAFFMPIFFATAGLHTNLTILSSPVLLGLSVVLILIASIGKFGGAFLGAAIGKLTRAESLAIAFGMNARGSTEVIVASIGLGLGVLSQDLFTMIVTMAIATTVAMPATLRWSLRKIPIGAEEQARLDREEAESTGFLANIERVLVAADQGPNGHFTSRLAGIVAGGRQIPTTVLDLSATSPLVLGPPAALAAMPGNETIGSTASAAAATSATEAGTKPPRVDTAKPQAADSPEAAVAGLARRGYDLMWIGLDRPVLEDGTFVPEVHRVTNEFASAVAIVLGKSEHLASPSQAPLRILVPVTGTNYSRRAAELALGIARAGSGQVTALYVSTDLASRTRPRWRQQLALSDQEEAILREVRRLAEVEGISVRTRKRAHAQPEEAILQEVARGAHNLVLLGVSRRPGEEVFFGNIPKSVVTRCPVSVVLLSTASQA